MRQSTHKAIKNFIYDKMEQFAVDYDISADDVYDWVTETQQGSTEFSDWLCKMKIFNCSPLIFVNYIDSRIFCGIDIVEDELFTLTMMKIQ